jgi:K+-sensing histidine kinase KdpD
VWTVAVAPPFALIGALYWLQRFDLTNEQVWTVANASATGLGVGTVLVFGGVFLTQSVTVTRTGFLFLGTTLATMAVGGALAGLVACLHESTASLERQNTVLHRVLRHNLRNDMTVVMCMLDDIEAQSEGDCAETARDARERIRSVVELTDKVRQANLSRPETADPQHSLDVASLVGDRVRALEETHPALDIETDLPPSAEAYVEDPFGLVVDYLVESAIEHSCTVPDLTMSVSVDRRTVSLTIEDDSQTLPDAEFAAVASGGETPLEHGLGVDLWLVDWLVAANNGEVIFQDDGSGRCVTIELTRARSGVLQ